MLHSAGNGQGGLLVRASYLEILLFVTALIVGCDRRTSVSTPAPTSAPTTSASHDEDPSEAANLIKSATSRPAVPASMTIDDKEYDFPPVRMQLKSRSGEIIALLTTDDPPSAADPDYNGNSVYLEMTLTIPESRTLSGAHWEFKALNAEREDEINGIYLQGKKLTLQPAEVHADILGDISPVKLRMMGTFYLFDEESVEPKQVMVKTDMTVVVKVES